MKVNPRFFKLMSIFCWLGTAMVLLLEAYLLRTMSRFPEVALITRNARIVGVLLIVWLAVSVWFTVLARKSRQENKK